MNRVVCRSRRGAALIVVLSMIVILTFLVVAFVSRSRFSSTASSHFSSAVSAQNLAEDAVNSVVASLQQEIAAPAKSDTLDATGPSGESRPLYLPKTDADLLPARDAEAAAQNVPHLLKTSQAAEFFPGGPPTHASAVSTSASSANGSFLSAASWNKAALLPANAAGASPHWIYVNRNGPVALTAWSSALADSRPGNPEKVIGRYAYRVYDLSGLLDVNVAGTTASSDDVHRKGSLAFADLGAPDLADAAAGQLLSWRSGAADLAEVDQFRRFGFLVMPASGTAASANRFLGRNDLVEFYDKIAQNTAGLPSLTMFTRELNAPTWRPDPTATPPSTTPPAFNPSEGVASVRVGGDFTRRDAGALWPDAPASQAVPGEPLVKQRFPLSKIALFTDPAGNAIEIERWFGLRANARGSWDYVHGKVSDSAFAVEPGVPAAEAAVERLRTLAEVAAAGREPNFFEYLQAGILGESLGQSARDVNVSGAITQARHAERNIARHVLSIGANVIDQYDEDNDPTVIAFDSFDSIGTPSGVPLDTYVPDVAGIENLPYIQLITQDVFRRHDKPDTTPPPNGPNYPKIAVFFRFQLWNPLRNAADSTGSFRLVALGSIGTRIAYAFLGGGTLHHDFEPALHQIEFQLSSGAGTLFATPRLLRPDDPSLDVTVTNAAANEYHYPSSAAGGVHLLGFWGGDYDAPYSGLPSGPDSHFERYERKRPSETERPAVVVDKSQGLAFQLQKLNSQSQWMPVQTIGNLYNEGRVYVYTVFRSGSESTTQRIHADPNFVETHFVFADPRTTRLAPGKWGYLEAQGTYFTPLTATPDVIDRAFSDTAPGRLYHVNDWQGIGGTGKILAPLYELYHNNGSSSYKERGGAVTRLGDTPAASPYSDPSARPIVLNRPFRSVAEMGYAFRDLPWKSLNFSQDVAAGGMNTADAGLLDLFTLTESPVRSGVVNLNTASEAVLHALLRGTDLEVPGADARLSDAEAEALAGEIRTYLGPRDNPSQVIRTAADLTRMISSLSAVSSWSKMKKEAIVAALAEAHNARTWNLLIDVIAQSGQFPNVPAGSLDRFYVTGQQHLLVQVALDRYTGKLVERITEQPLE